MEEIKAKRVTLIQRLLAKASSSKFLAEANTFRRKARQLMLKYSITEYDLTDILPHYTPPTPTPTPGPVYQPQYVRTTTTGNSTEWNEVQLDGWNIRWNFSGGS